MSVFGHALVMLWSCVGLALLVYKKNQFWVYGLVDFLREVKWHEHYNLEEIRDPEIVKLHFGKNVNREEDTFPSEYLCHLTVKSAIAFMRKELSKLQKYDFLMKNFNLEEDENGIFFYKGNVKCVENF